MAGLELPIATAPLQACVTEPLKPFLDVVVVSGSLHVYVSQSSRGELVMGASVDPFGSYSMNSSLDFVEGLAGHVLELFPFLSKVRILRQWAGLCEMPPDFSPLMGFTPVEGFLLDVGWGTYGFKASPICGKTMAGLIATNTTPDLIYPFRLSRFAEFDLVGEKGAAAVGHRMMGAGFRDRAPGGIGLKRRLMSDGAESTSPRSIRGLTPPAINGRPSGAKPFSSANSAPSLACRSLGGGSCGERFMPC